MELHPGVPRDVVRSNGVGSKSWHEIDSGRLSSTWFVEAGCGLCVQDGRLRDWGFAFWTVSLHAVSDRRGTCYVGCGERLLTLG